MLRNLSIAAFCFAAAAATAANTKWTIIDLGGEPYGSYAQAVNNRGEVTGYKYTAQGFHHAFVWRNGVMEDIGVPAGYFESNPVNMNNNGTVVGSVGSGYGGIGNAAYYKDGTWTVLARGTALDVNESGTVVGSAYTSTPFPTAFMFRDGVMTDLGTLGGVSSAAWAVNNRGTIVGSSVMPGNESLHAFIYENGTMRDLGAMGGKYSWAFDINSRGTVVGRVEPAGGGVAAFIYDGGSMRKLFDYAGGSWAKAINERGSVVGSTDRGGFLFEDGKLTMLAEIPEVKAAGWGWLEPHSINDRGWIVGVGSHDMMSRSFLLVPN